MKSRKFFHLLMVFASFEFLLGGISLTNPVWSQQNKGILEQLNEKLHSIENRIENARSEQVDILSPSAFENTEKHYDKARKDLDEGKDVKSIRENLDKADRYLTLAEKNAKEARKQLPHVITAREEALVANAPEHAPELYQEAEDKFKDAMEEIEDNDINGAIKKGKEAEENFRTAELRAIKQSIIGPVHRLVEKAKEAKAEKFAPLTLAKAQTLLANAENTLNTNRNAQSKAGQMAEQAGYEARHAAYLAELIQTQKKDDENWEKLFLDYERDINKVGKELNVNPKFDSGFSQPLNSIHLAVVAIKDYAKDMVKEIDQKNGEIDQLREKLQSLSNELDATRAQEAGLQQKLEAEKRKEAKLKRIEDTFSPNEAIVLRKGTDMVLRLVGLTFASGKSEIEAKYFGLLTKVQKAIREFPNAFISIEGHTDSRGHDSANLRLSKERAEAVKTYLLANMSLSPTQIRAIGYGESKPVASNETKDGRRRNRRIDIVMEIGQASY